MDIPVTLIIPVYKPKLPDLKRCLNSILTQRSMPSQIIIIDDGNQNDELDSVIQKFSTQVPKAVEVCYVQFPQNRGVSISRNEGIKNAKFKIIGFIDADDWLHPDYFYKLYEPFEKASSDKDIGIVACSCYGVRKDKYGKVKHVRNHFYMNDDGQDYISPNTFVKMLINPIYMREGTEIDTAIGVPWGKFFNFNVIKNIWFNPDLKRMQDNIFNHTIVVNCPNITIKYIDEPLYYYNTEHIIQYTNSYEEDITVWINIIKERAKLIRIYNDAEIYKFFHEEVLRIVHQMILGKKFFHPDNPDRRGSFKILKELLRNAEIRDVLKKEVKNSLPHRNLMYKLLLMGLITPAYVVYKLRNN